MLAVALLQVAQVVVLKSLAPEDQVWSMMAAVAVMMIVTD